MNETEPSASSIPPAQWGIVALVIAFSAGSVLYKLLMHARFGHSAAMFIGVPAVLAILLARHEELRRRTVVWSLVAGATACGAVIAVLFPATNNPNVVR